VTAFAVSDTGPEISPPQFTGITPDATSTLTMQKILKLIAGSGIFNGINSI
jgi:hypothetical protein